MKYFTKEYRDAFQNIFDFEGYEILEGENFNIDLIYKQREAESVEHERAIYDTPPTNEKDILSKVQFLLEDLLVSDTDAEGNEINFRTPESFEEWEEYAESTYKRRYQEYLDREPFDEEEVREIFKINFDIAVNEKWQMPAWVYEKVDPRLIALYYLPKDVYQELKEISDRSENWVRSVQQAEENDPHAENIPKRILENLELHDASLQTIEEKGGNVFLKIIDDTFSGIDAYSTLEFVEAEIIENELMDAKNFGQDLYNIYFIMNEVYNYGDYFEFHFMLDDYTENGGESLYLTIRAKDLILHKKQFEEE